MANIIERGNDRVERTGEVLGVDAYQGQQDQKNSQVGDDIKGRAALVDGINRFTFNDDGYRAFGDIMRLSSCLMDLPNIMIRATFKPDAVDPDIPPQNIKTTGQCEQNRPLLNINGRVCC